MIRIDDGGDAPDRLPSFERQKGEKLAVFEWRLLWLKNLRDATRKRGHKLRTRLNPFRQALECPKVLLGQTG